MRWRIPGLAAFFRSAFPARPSYPETAMTLDRRQAMSDAATKPADKSDSKPAVAETKPAGKAETATGKPAEAKPADKAEAKPADKAEAKPVGKVESRQAGKGSKRRPCNARKFEANYQAIHWGRGQSQRSKH